MNFTFTSVGFTSIQELHNYKLGIYTNPLFFKYKIFSFWIYTSIYKINKMTIFFIHLVSVKTKLQLLEIHLPSKFIIYGMTHILNVQNFLNLKLEFVFSHFYLGSLGDISIHFECCIQLPQSRRIHSKVISQMC